MMVVPIDNPDYKNYSHEYCIAYSDDTLNRVIRVKLLDVGASDADMSVWVHRNVLEECGYAIADTELALLYEDIEHGWHRPLLPNARKI